MAHLVVSVAGVDVTAKTRFGTLAIHEVLGPAPNKADLSFDGTAPTAGNPIKIGLGDVSDANLIFSGEIQIVDESYQDAADPSLVLWPGHLVDQGFRLNKRRPFGTWTNVSASTIGASLVSVFAPADFTADIEANLPAVTITFDGTQDFLTCWGQLATLIGGRGTVEYDRRVRLFITDTEPAPTPITASNPPLSNPPLKYTTDLSQIRTRIYGRGHGEALLSDVSAGETILPIADASQFNVNGGQIIGGTISQGAQSQIMTYGGVQAGGGGSLIGSGAQPNTAPTGKLASGGSVELGDHLYAVVFITASGHSLPGPSLTKSVVASISAPSSAPVEVFAANTGGCTPGFHDIAVTFVTADGETTPGPRDTNLASSPGTKFTYTIPTGPTGTTARNIYLTTANNSGGTLLFAFTVNDNTTTSILVDTPDASLGAAAPSSNTTGGQTVDLSNIPIGPSGTTGRDLYRSAAGATQLKALHSIADNSTTTYADTTADASLGANAPSSDTSGLSQPQGQVNAGATSILVASAADFVSGGGWVLANNQPIRYTGLSGSALTGVPATGPGSIASTLLYGVAITPTPALTAVNGVYGADLAMAKGASVSVWVQRDDLAAQAVLADLEVGDGGSPSDGVREDVIVDERRSEDSLIALCDARLAQFSAPVVGLTFTIRDRNARIGRTVRVDLVGFYDSSFYDDTFYLAYDGSAAIPLQGSFVIQQVDITLDETDDDPLRAVTASSALFTLADLLRLAALAKA